MKYLALSLLLVACGGDPFNGDNAAVGGDDSVLAGAAGDSSDVGGSASVAGKSSSGGSVSDAGAATAGAPVGGAGGGGGHAGAPSGGMPTGGSTSGGAGTAGGGAGGGTSTCALDLNKLTAALPKSLVWQSATVTNGESCVTCRDKPCGTEQVISWGAPQTLPDGRINYLPNTNKSTVSVNVGKNDGMCTKTTECSLKTDDPGLALTVERSATGWKVSLAQVAFRFNSGACNVDSVAVIALQSDFGDEVSASLKGLEIPCAN